MSGISTKPYLIRAIHEWCTDSGYRPYIAVAVDEHTIVPREFVRAGEIVLNVSVAATNRLRIGNDLIEFEARFGGVARTVSIPIDNVSAIYAQETGQGMAFEVPKPLALVPEPSVEGGAGEGPAEAESPSEAQPEAGAEPQRPRRRPKLAAVPSPSSEPGELPASAAVEDAAPAKAPRRRRKPASKGGEAGAEVSTGAADAGVDAEPARPAEGAPTAPAGQPGDDGDKPRPPSGRPTLTRVK